MPLEIWAGPNSERRIRPLGLQPFQQRVVEERDELRERTEKLLTFIESEAFRKVGRAEQQRMRKQAKAMTDYGNVLAERIANFTSPEDELLVFSAQRYFANMYGVDGDEVIRMAMDTRQLASLGLPTLPDGLEQNLQHVFRRDFEAGEQFKDVVLL